MFGNKRKDKQKEEQIEELSERLIKQDKRIFELETKLAAALELLNIRYAPANKEPAKLVKGNKSVEIDDIGMYAIRQLRDLCIAPKMRKRD